MMSLVGIIASLAVPLVALILANNAVIGLTGKDIGEFFLDLIPNLVNMVSSLFDIFRMFFDLLPRHVGSILGVFLTFMIPFVLYKLWKGGS